MVLLCCVMYVALTHAHKTYKYNANTLTFSPTRTYLRDFVELFRMQAHGHMFQMTYFIMAPPLRKDHSDRVDMRDFCIFIPSYLHRWQQQFLSCGHWTSIQPYVVVIFFLDWWNYAYSSSFCMWKVQCRYRKVRTHLYSVPNIWFRIADALLSNSSACKNLGNVILLCVSGYQYEMHSSPALKSWKPLKVASQFWFK